MELLSKTNFSDHFTVWSLEMSFIKLEVDVFAEMCLALKREVVAGWTEADERKADRLGT